MKKRLRKKKNIGEYKIFGVEIAITFKSETVYEVFLDDLIDMAENHDCWMSGSGNDEGMEGFIELGQLTDDPESKLKAITTWLDQQSKIEKYKIGGIIDAIYGPFEGLTTEE